MGFKYFKIVFVILFSTLLSISNSSGQDLKDVGEIEVSMRMIGHQILLQFGDSTSLILPIEKEGDRYRIRFESEFQFDPNDLVATIDSVVLNANMATNYLVEVEKCETGEVVYAYVSRVLDDSSVIPCGTRTQACACYSVLITILEDIVQDSSLYLDPPNRREGVSSGLNQGIVFVIIVMLLLIGWAVNFRKKNLKSSIGAHIIAIGNYQFDNKNMKLSFEGNSMVLTSKETDLLYMLYSSVNKTLERDEILKAVWGNEGDYVGRTLDVFISKLRKKLEADPTVKIVNIRGVGYKMIIDND